ncbi:MAG: hypothetical protein JXA90_03110 [Planctomycetes bacterium]|nr:hypothetical protein [Planctomycetota bacterium]
MTALVAQLVAVACAELGLPAAVTRAIVDAAVQIAAMIPMARLESMMFAVMREGAKWLISRPPGPDSTAPDLGGNVPAERPPIELEQPPGDPDPLP